MSRPRLTIPVIKITSVIDEPGDSAKAYRGKMNKNFKRGDQAQVQKPELFLSSNVGGKLDIEDGILMLSGPKQLRLLAQPIPTL